MRDTKFWTEDVCQTAIGVCGIVGNILAIAIFISGGKKYATIFYRLLMCLFIANTFLISFTLVNYYGQKTDNQIFNILFVYGLYPVPSLMFQTSTLLTVLLDWHRFNAALRPLEYLVAISMTNSSNCLTENLDHFA
jgi:hypothetical protein